MQWVLGFCFQTLRGPGSRGPGSCGLSPTFTPYLCHFTNCFLFSYFFLAFLNMLKKTHLVHETSPIVVVIVVLKWKTTTTIDDTDTNDLQVLCDVHTNDWQWLRIMRTVIIVANRYFKFSGNQINVLPPNKHLLVQIQQYKH